jgi:anti-sigma regulatory factor (Ser/Thr protein kinase)
VLARVLGDASPSDDVALLAVRPGPVEAGAISLSLPAEPESLPGLRRRLVRFLQAAGADEEETYEIALTVCEAAGNAIEHAYGPADATFEVEARARDGELTAVIRDKGNWREPRAHGGGRGLKIMDGLMDELEVQTEESGTVVRMRRRLRGQTAG